MSLVIDTLSWSLSALLFMGVASGTHHTSAILQDLSGRRFRCAEPSATALCLRLATEECHISIAPGRGLPREPTDVAVVARKGETQEIKGPEDLVDCVTINNEDDALEYVRFFSSYRTVHLFRERVLEIFPSSDTSCFAICVPDERWRQLGLHEAAARKVEDWFEVSRTVIEPTSRIPEVRAFRLVQKVGRNGSVSEVSRYPIDLPEDLKLRLSFPSFL